MYCANCTKDLVYCQCLDLDERLQNLAGNPSTAMLAAGVIANRNRVKAASAGNQTGAKAGQKAFVSVAYTPGVSPMAKLVDGPEAKKWAEDKLNEVEKAIKRDIVYSAPESPKRARYYSSECILKKLIAGENINLWDANRELAKKYPLFNSHGFQEACEELLG